MKLRAPMKALLCRLISPTIRRYLIATVIVFAVNIALAIMLHEVFGLREEAAVAGSVTAVFVLTFLLMRFYIYGDRTRKWWRQFTVYAPSAVLFRGMEYASFHVLYALMTVDYRLLFVAILIVSWAMKFMYYRYVVFDGSGSYGPVKVEPSR